MGSESIKKTTIKYIFLLLLIIQSFNSYSQNNIVLKNANIVDTKNGIILKNRVIIIEKGIIKRILKKNENIIGKSTIDLNGKFVVPGMVDMHAHLPGKKGQPHNLDNYLKLNLVHGITSLRCMRGNEFQLALRDSLKKSHSFAPRLFVSCPPIRKNTIEAAESLVSFKKQDYDFVKILSVKDTLIFKRILKVSDSLDMKVAGHVPFNDLGFALDKGQASVEHIEAISNYSSKTQLKNKIKILEKNQAYLCPTAYWYVINGYSTSIDSLKTLDGKQFINPLLFHKWVKIWERKISQTSKYKARKEKYFQLRQNFESFLKLAGNKSKIKYLISPGDGFFTIPGKSFFSEIEYLKKHGLSNKNLLKAATYNAGEFLDPKIGEIKEGGFADLIFTKENPLKNIAALQNIEGIVFKGHFYDKDFILKTKEELLQFNQ